MEDLLINEFISYYNLPELIIDNWVEKTVEKYFEVDDTNTGEIILHTLGDPGIAKFSNPDALHISILNYDKFVTNIQSAPFKNGRKRCDIIVCCNTNGYLVLGELKDRDPSSKVRSEAKRQLLSSLQTLIAVPEIDTFINSKNVKRCCYFNKQSTLPMKLNLKATIAFNRLSNIYPDGFQMSKPDIEALGFEFYEYTGAQTMTLTH